MCNNESRHVNVKKPMLMFETPTLLQVKKKISFLFKKIMRYKIFLQFWEFIDFIHQNPTILKEKMSEVYFLS